MFVESALSISISCAHPLYTDSQECSVKHLNIDLNISPDSNVQVSQQLERPYHAARSFSALCLATSPTCRFIVVLERGKVVVTPYVHVGSVP